MPEKSQPMSQNNGNNNLRLKTGLAEMLKGGVIMDVTTAKQAEIAERAGAVAVMALERVPAQIRAEGGVARMASPKIIREIMGAVDIPVMAKCRIGHFAEAQILQELGVDYIDESEVLTPADEAAPCRQACLYCSLRLRSAQPGRSSAPHCRRRGHDSHQGRSWHRRRSPRRPPHSPDRAGDEDSDRARRRRTLRQSQRAWRSL